MKSWVSLKDPGFTFRAVLFVEHAVLRGHSTDATVDHLHWKLLLLCDNLFSSFTLFFLEWLSILFCLLL
jgi:hypothetical protein